MAGLGAVGLATVGAGERGAVHLAGWLPATPLMVLVAHEAGEGGPTALGGQGVGKRPAGGWAFLHHPPSGCGTDLLGTPQPPHLLQHLAQPLTLLLLTPF